MPKGVITPYKQDNVLCLIMPHERDERIVTDRFHEISSSSMNEVGVSVNSG